MDYEKATADEFGKSLDGLGLNILVRDVLGMVDFLKAVFGMNAFQAPAHFAIMRYGNQVFQLHADHTYHSHPLPSLLPESGPRGGGLEIRLYDTDPDEAAAQAASHAHASTLLQAPENKPHGLRECVILCENGYAWLPSRRLTQEETEELAG